MAENGLRRAGFEAGPDPQWFRSRLPARHSPEVPSRIATNILRFFSRAWVLVIAVMIRSAMSAEFPSRIET
jgi:hypothetical protein